MDVQQWERTKQILEEALRLAPTERAGYLDSACGSDGELRVEVESLIASHEQAGSRFLESAPAELSQLTLGRTTQSPVLNQIGNYRLVEPIGRGGMGQVWLADQVAPVRRRVALKLIRAGLFDDQLLKRFELERQSLAIMDHPNIAKVFDAGATPEGQPYFVMEYVPGLPITDYCDQKQLKIRERLELFVKVCEAVQHAHQKAILHRDLKPANILVQEVDGKPVPRIIDFGLAKATTPEIGGESLYTQFGGFVGTPGYMSPEQCDESAPDVDTRSDVYSLGVVLYVLLTGCLPFQEKPGKDLPLEQMLRRMREEDPPRPSTKVNSNRQDSSATAAARGAESKQLVSLLRGDLDWITMKALEKDRARRYGTASELAADVTRYLKNEPVTARPASLPYRVRKYVRRHRVAVGVGVGLVAVLAGFAVNEAIQVRRITRERDRADRIAQFMTDMFKVSDPTKHVGEVTAREVLDKASGNIENGLVKDPELQARLMHVMGEAYTNLGVYQRGQSLLERSLRIDSSVLGLENRETLDTMDDLSWLKFQQGDYAGAEKLQREAIDIERRVFGDNDPVTVHTVGNLATTLAEAGNLPEAIRLTRELVEKKKRLFGPESFDVLVSMDDLSAMLEHDGRLAEADQLERKTLEIQLRVFGENNLGTISSMLNLADIQREMGKDQEAEKLYRETLALEARVLGPDQPEAAETKYNLACLLARRGQKNEALSLLSQAVEHGLEPRIDLQIEKQPYFEPLRSDPRFAALVLRAKERAAAVRSK